MNTERNNNLKNKSKFIHVRMPFRILLLFGYLFLFYTMIKAIISPINNTNIVFLLLGLFYFFVLFGFSFQFIFRKKDHGCYFFNCNYEKTKLYKYLTKNSNKLEKPKKIYFKKARVNIERFLVSKIMVQIWGIFDLLTLLMFWKYFFNNLMLVNDVLFKDSIVKFSMLPHYLTALVSISLLFSGILLIIPNKFSGRIVAFQMLLKMFAYLPSIFPILWLIGFSIEHRYIKALLIITLCVEYIRVFSIRNFFKLDKNPNYCGYIHDV